jgi:hypothetical protein
MGREWGKGVGKWGFGIRAAFFCCGGGWGVARQHSEGRGDGEGRRAGRRGGVQAGHEAGKLQILGRMN